MGIFSLANRGCTISANYRSIKLEPEHFTGEKEVEVKTSFYGGGTRILIPLSRNEIEKIPLILSKCTLYYPLPVYWQGKELTRQNFMKDALYTENWQEVEIGVFSHNYYSERLNFYGLAIDASLPFLTNCLVENYSNLWIRIDVIDAPELRLILPSRKEVVHNHFFQALQKEALHCLYRYLLQVGKHYLPFSKYYQAHEAGIPLPVAEAQLEKYEPKVGDDEGCHFSSKLVSLTENTMSANVPFNQYLVVAFDREPIIEQIFDRNFTKAYPDKVLLRENKEMEHYDWYDDLAKITDISIFVYYSDNSYRLDAIPSALTNERPDKITIALTIDGEQVFIPADFASWNEYDSLPIDDSNVLDYFVPKDISIDIDEIVELLFDSFFSYCSDGDADSYERQVEYFRQETLFDLTSFLGSKEVNVSSMKK